MFRTVVSAALFAAALHAPAFSQAFSEPGLEAFQSALDSRVQAGRRSGYAVLLMREGETRILTSGATALDGETPMSAETLMRMASMTKPVTAVATMMLVERGAISLDDPVSVYIPAFANTEVATAFDADEAGAFTTTPQTSPMTVRHLLTHTSGIGYIFDFETGLGQAMAQGTLYQGEGDLEAKMDELARFPLYFQPGDRWFYSYSNDVLGRVVEVASGMSFEAFLESQIFAPLGMNDTGFYLSDDELASAATLYTHAEGGGLVAPYSDENPEYQPTWSSGGGGLISTGQDYARFAMMLAMGGELDGVRILAPETLAEMTRPQVDPAQLPAGMAGWSYGYGVGIVLPGTDGRPAMGIPGDFGWGGYFDTDFFVSPSSGLVAIMMTQILPGPHMPEGRTASWWRAAAYATLPQ